MNTITKMYLLMSYIDFMKSQKTLKTLIESERTGTAKELANRFHFSSSTLFYHFDALKEEGFIINFAVSARHFTSQKTKMNNGFILVGSHALML